MSKEKLTEEQIKKKEEMEHYQKTTFWSKVPFSIKAILIKYWFYGAICFFTFMGLGLYVESNFNLVLIAGILGGAIFDIACYNILVMIDDNNKAKYHMIYKSKSVLSIVICVLFSTAVFFIFSYSTNAIKVALGVEKTWFLQEPLTQGLGLILIDEAMIWIKNGIVYLVKKK